jgi:phosphate transport system protein
MLEMAMEAYAEDDAEACYDVADHDDEVDEMCAQASELVVRDLLESEALEPGTTTQDEAPEAASEAEVETLMQDVSRLLLTIRDLERVGDHAVNIAARTLYMVENSDELIY